MYAEDIKRCLLILLSDCSLVKTRHKYAGGSASCSLQHRALSFMPWPFPQPEKKGEQVPCKSLNPLP
jgi:hypothetical protein